MQNKSSMLSSLKQREDAGWIKLHQQLDVDLPVKKDKNRKFFWIFLFTGLGLGGFLWSSRSGRLTTDKSIIPTVISKDSLHDKSNLINTPEKENVMALTAADKKSKLSTGKINSETTEASDKSQFHTTLNKNKTIASKEKYDTGGNNKTIQTGLVSSFTPNESLIKNGNTPKRFDKEKPNKNMDLTNEENIKSNHAEESEVNQIANTQKNISGNQSISSLDLMQVSPLPQNNSIHSSGSKMLPPVSLANPIDFQKTNTLIDIRKSKPSAWFLQGATALQGSNYWSSSFTPGVSINLSTKWSINALAGIGYQYSNNKGTALQTGSNASYASGNNLDAKNSAVYSQSVTQIFLDKSNGMTRLSNGVLYISASDQVLYTQASHFNLMGQTSLSYAVSSRWFVESGIYFHKALSKNYNQIIVQSSSLNNNGALNAQATSSKFNIYTGNVPFDFHFIFEAGYRINRKIDLSLSYAAESFSIVLPGKRALFSPQSTVPQPVSVSAFELPNTDGAAFARFAIRYHL